MPTGYLNIKSKNLTNELNTETLRATAAEETITNNLDAEITRAKEAEKKNEDAISTESARAAAAESALQTDLTLATAKANANETSISAISAKIAPQASADNQVADKAFVNSSINNIAAYFITKDAVSNPFATKAELIAATTFYSGGEIRVPTRNDYTIVLADESHKDTITGQAPTTRYIYNNGWEFQYVVNNSALTAAQWAALNSNITAEKIAALDSKNTSQDTTITSISAVANAALPKTGGELNGQLYWNANSLKALSCDYLLGIQGFSPNAATGYISLADLKSKMFDVTKLNTLLSFVDGSNLRIPNGSRIYFGPYSDSYMQYVNSGNIEIRTTSLNSYVQINQQTFSTSSCFIDGTLVWTVTGLKPIETIVEGEEVYSYNEETKEIEIDTIAKKHEAEQKDFCIFTLEDGTTIQVTPRHGFYYAKTNSWIPAEMFNVGDEFFSPQREILIKIISIEKIVVEPTHVTNFMLKNNHNFFVSSDYILVHNAIKG